MIRTIDLSMKKVPRQRRAEVTVEAMIDAASELLSTLPYDSVTTNRIAERAGVGIGSLYQYFPNKEAIVARVVAYWVQDMLEEVGNALAASTQLSLAEAALAIVSTLFEVVDRHRVKVRLILEVIPFALQIPAVANLPRTLVMMSAQAQASIRDRLNFARPEVASYVLMVMTRASIIETVLHCPPHLARPEVERTIADFIARIMVGNTSPLVAA
ncbi:TetR/AcrR family transcriptional regulator [Zavarzinia sp.]|uniref:TetR/AcrR family transcriptional regulator n=1 Tax=Zavarzinia sp. TaxID=2027920 RepID=UPI003BB7C46D|nr:TetR/AcrR family transcriptional regulator [Zavarzinia sp.]